SVVIPVYCEEESINKFSEILEEVTSRIIGYSWEYIFVNDGSRDRTLQMAKEISKNKKNFKIIDLSRNFGKEIALSAGIEYAKGDAVICMDADLQHPPEKIPLMVAAWENGAEVVEMVRTKNKKKSLKRKIGSRTFYYLLNKISDTKIQSRTTDFRLLDRKVVNSLVKIQEKQRMFRGLVDWLGFKKVILPFDENPRHGGKSVYSYGKLTTLAFNSFVSHSAVPLKGIGILGLLIVIGSGLLILIMLSTTFVAPQIFNFTPLAILVVANTFLIGIVLTAMGLMSLYIAKIYSETQNRPLFVIREFHENDGKPGTEGRGFLELDKR
ncbi:MAG: glycosyltransferase family 2 protein, partial [Oligoflexales bacterium]|nr:glycosyltransferase family 2 protein [Oligoflexales bacterium]